MSSHGGDLLQLERGVFSILSVDMVGSSNRVRLLDPDDTQDLLDAGLETVRMAVEGAGGTIISYNGDGALAIFGWPHRLEDHADRACEAAWNIQNVDSRSGQLPASVQFRVGVNSGLIAIRRLDLGVTERLDAIGAPTHDAAGLQQIAEPGSIIVSAATTQLCTSQLQLEQIDTDQATGKAPCRAFRLAAAPSPYRRMDLGERYPNEIVGRQAERHQIARLLESHESNPQSIALIGDPGLGKSRLAADLIAKAKRTDRAIFVAEGIKMGRSKSFSVVRDLLLDGLDTDDKIAHAQIEASLKMEASEQASRAVLAILGKADNDKSKSGATQTEVAALFAGLIRRLLFNKPSLLVVEDLQFLDPESRQVLRLLAQSSRDHLFSILTTSRPEGAAEARKIVERVITLEPLNDDEIWQLCKLGWPSLPLSPEHIAQAIGQAEGNPLVFEQIMQNCSDQSAAIDFALPQTMESLIHSRMGELSVPARSVLQVLSLLGEKAELDLIHVICGGMATDSGQVLHELETFAFIHSPADRRIRFRHSLIADACSSTIHRDLRHEIHRSAIAAITELYHDLSDYHTDLAHHAIGAGDDALAIEHLWQAARRARRTSSSQSLMQLFEGAMNCCERLGADGEERFVDFVLLSFETYHLVGAIDQIAPLVERAATYAEKQGRPDRLCVARCHQGISFWYQGRYEEGVHIITPALKQARKLDHLPLRFAAQFTLAQQLHNMGQIEEAYRLVIELVGLLKGDLATSRLGAMGLPAAVALSHAGYYLLEQGEYEKGENHCRDALDISLRGRDPYSQVLCLIGLGRSLILQQRYNEAVEFLKQSHALIESFGFDPANPHNVGHLCTALTRIEDTDSAIDLAQNCLAKGLLKRTGKYEQHYFACGYGEALIAKGSIEAGLRQIDKAIEIGRTTANPCILVQSLTLKAQLSSLLPMAPADIAELERERDHIANRFGLVVAPTPATNYGAKRANLPRSPEVKPKVF